MKIISLSQDFEHEFLRLQEKYNEYYWTVAWAGVGSKPFEVLKKNRQKIKKILVGLHFYQTHPEFIKEFLIEKSIKYIKKTDGTFHPKLYLFKNNETEWEVIIGSPNFTNSAFTINSEVSILISSKDSNSNMILSEVEKYITGLWNSGVYFNDTIFNDYLNSWKLQNVKINKLAGIYKSTGKPIFETGTLSLTWSQYLEKIKNEQNNGCNNRVFVIKIAKSLFMENKKFHNMNIEERKFIAGIPNRLEIEGAQFWAYFGSMKGAGKYKNRIIENDENISIALDQIPLLGQVTRQDYLNFWNYYEKVFNENYIATATRLLCMKRPDVFLCFDSKNKTNLCNDFGINKTEINKEYYWDGIIERVFDSNWWQNPYPNPENEKEKIINYARVAFLDSIFYEE